jgi:hypothetical protein
MACFSYFVSLVLDEMTLSGQILKLIRQQATGYQNRNMGASLSMYV